MSRRASHPSRGAWIEIIIRKHFPTRCISSHPSRGAWIEIIWKWAVYVQWASRTPHGVRGLKWQGEVRHQDRRRRTPHGVRGLKLLYVALCAAKMVSHPSRGAWIEIVDGKMALYNAMVAPLTGCVD